MTVKRKVSLNADKSIGYGHLLYCCGIYQPVHIDELQEGDWWECLKCNKSLLLATETGFYTVGESVTI